MKRLFEIFSVLIPLLIPSVSYAWWNKDWEYRKKILIDTSPTGVAIGENLVGFAAPVRLHTVILITSSISNPTAPTYVSSPAMIRRH